MESSYGWVLESLKLVKPELALVAALLVVILIDLTRIKNAAAFLKRVRSARITTKIDATSAVSGLTSLRPSRTQLLSVIYFSAETHGMCICSDSRLIAGMMMFR